MANIVSDAVGIFALPATRRQPKAEGAEDVKAEMHEQAAAAH